MVAVREQIKEKELEEDARGSDSEVEHKKVAKMDPFFQEAGSEEDESESEEERPLKKVVTRQGFVIAPDKMEEQRNKKQ
jgi:hypothetical protein